MSQAVAQYMETMRATCIPCGSAGLWYVDRRKTKVVSVPDKTQYPQRPIPPGLYTRLMRLTDAHLYDGGETVMIDAEPELRTHLDFAIRARGRVLITGLGLGCVLRGVQQNMRVSQITVVERDASVIKLVWPHTPHDRTVLVEADAADFLARTTGTWDCAWHDLWTDESSGEGTLLSAHLKVITAGCKKIGWQGAWQMPRWAKRRIETVWRRRAYRKAVSA